MDDLYEKYYLRGEAAGINTESERRVAEVTRLRVALKKIQQFAAHSEPTRESLDALVEIATSALEATPAK